jgi:hypothetical protein
MKQAASRENSLRKYSGLYLKKRRELALFSVCFMVVSFFYPDDGSDVFLRNII